MPHKTKLEFNPDCMQVRDIKKCVETLALLKRMIDADPDDWETIGRTTAQYLENYEVYS